MAYLTLQNKKTKAQRCIDVPFDMEKLFDTLTALRVPYDREKWLRGEIEDIEIVDCHDLYAGTRKILESNNPVYANLSEMAYDSCSNQTAAETYIEYIGVDDLLEYCNVMMQGDDIYCGGYEYGGYGYEGYGRIMAAYGDEICIPDWADSYFDYEAYGRDCAESYEVAVEDYHYVEYGNSDVNETYYSFEEICDEFDWDLDYADGEEGPQYATFDIDMIMKLLGGDVAC